MATDRYKIGEFTLDVSQGCLRRGDIELALRPKSFALLQHLIIHAGRLVTKDELMSEIWPNVIVTEDSLTRCISEARAALGDSEQTAIKTVSKRGYVFAKPVTEIHDKTVVQPVAIRTRWRDTPFKDGPEPSCCRSSSAFSLLRRQSGTPLSKRGRPRNIRACR